MAMMLGGVNSSRLEEKIEVPWFQPPLKISVRHALMQAAMHSHFHRGQNATRLRELGALPPGTDFIEWFTTRPAAGEVEVTSRQGIRDLILQETTDPAITSIPVRL